MRTTLDLPEPLLRSLKIQAAQNGKTLKSLLHELIVRAVQMPPSPVLVSSDDSPPVLARLTHAAAAESAAVSVSTGSLSNAALAEDQLQDDLEKLRRSGFIS